MSTPPGSPETYKTNSTVPSDWSFVEPEAEDELAAGVEQIDLDAGDETAKPFRPASPINRPGEEESASSSAAGPPQASSSAGGASEPTASPSSSEAPQADSTRGKLGKGYQGCGAPVRHYAVWQYPSEPSLVGVHTGSHPEVWNGLLALLPGESKVGFRFRRFDSLQAAILGYRTEAPKQRAPLDPVIHCW